MKCAARAVRVMEHYNYQHKRYGEVLLNYIEGAAVYYAARAYRSMRSGPVVQKMLDEVVEWMVGDINGAAPDMLRLRDGGKSWWANEIEREDAAVSDTLFRWEREWRDYGFRDIVLAELEPDPITDPAPTQEVADARLARAEYMDVRGRDVVRLYTICFISWLAEQKFATGRARYSIETIEDMVYRPFAAEMRGMLRRFLCGSRSETARHEARLHEMERWILTECGIELTPVEVQEERRREKEKAESCPPAQKANDPRGELAAAILEGMKGEGFTPSVFGHVKGGRR